MYNFFGRLGYICNSWRLHLWATFDTDGQTDAGLSFHRGKKVSSYEFTSSPVVTWQRHEPFPFRLYLPNGAWRMFGCAKIFQIFSFVGTYSFHPFLYANRWGGERHLSWWRKMSNKTKTPRRLLSFLVFFFFRSK